MITNHEGTRMVKDGEDWLRLRTDYKFQDSVISDKNAVCRQTLVCDEPHESYFIWHFFMLYKLVLTFKTVTQCISTVMKQWDEVTLFHYAVQYRAFGSGRSLMP